VKLRETQRKGLHLVVHVPFPVLGLTSLIPSSEDAGNLHLMFLLKSKLGKKSLRFSILTNAAVQFCNLLDYLRLAVLTHVVGFGGRR